MCFWEMSALGYSVFIFIFFFLTQSHALFHLYFYPNANYTGEEHLVVVNYGKLCSYVPPGMSSLKITINGGCVATVFGFHRTDGYCGNHDFLIPHKCSSPKFPPSMDKIIGGVKVEQ